MNFVGYLVTMANLGAFAGPGSKAKDMSMRVAPLQNLAEEVRSLPNFPLDGFRNNGYYRSGYSGKYLSKNLQDYLFHGIGKPTDQGLIVTLAFEDESNEDGTEVLNDNSDHSAYFIHGEDIAPDVHAAVNSYINTGKYLQKNNRD